MQIPTRITARWLKSKGACAEQVKLFRRRYPNGITQITARTVGAAANVGLYVEWLARLFDHSEPYSSCIPCGHWNDRTLAAAIRAAQREG